MTINATRLRLSLAVLYLGREMILSQPFLIECHSILLTKYQIYISILIQLNVYLPSVQLSSIYFERESYPPSQKKNIYCNMYLGHKNDP